MKDRLYVYFQDILVYRFRKCVRFKIRKYFFKYICVGCKHMLHLDRSRCSFYCL